MCQTHQAGQGEPDHMRLGPGDLPQPLVLLLNGLYMPVALGDIGSHHQPCFPATPFNQIGFYLHFDHLSAFLFMPENIERPQENKFFHGT